jgi:hypothetical protein
MKTYIALLGASAQLGWGLLAPVPSPTDAATGQIDLFGVTPKPTTLAFLHAGLAKRQVGQSLMGYVSCLLLCKSQDANDLVTP